MKILAPAKINLFLKILKKDNRDGYHYINSIFYPVSLYDIIDIKLIKEPVIKIIDKYKVLRIKKEKNLIYKAIKLITHNKKLKNGVRVILYKNIPDGAGLGGGSSDAAATLIALNKLLKLNLSEKKLINYAKKLGSDVPFFILKKPAFVSGKGEKIKKIFSKKNYWVLLVVPKLKISTKDAYKWYDKLSRTRKRKNYLTNFKKNIILNKILLFNDFERIVIKKYKILQNIKEKLKKFTPYVSLSGSGSTIFALFETKHMAISSYKIAKKDIKNCKIFIVKTIS